MEPKIRLIITICEYKGKIIASAEIPELDAFNKLCYYSRNGKMKGSYIRVGDADLLMTDYEIYSFDVFKYKTEDELRIKERIENNLLNDIEINSFLDKIVSVKPNLDIVAVRCSTNDYGAEDSNGIRFLDNKRLDEMISEMLKLAISFVVSNIKKVTKINDKGIREYVVKYPIKAIRKIILNALINRDYSIHTENEPIRLTIFDDRIEMLNSGGLYGRLSLDELGKVHYDIRNFRGNRK